MGGGGEEKKKSVKNGQRGGDKPTEGQESRGCVGTGADSSADLTGSQRVGVDTGTAARECVCVCVFIVQVLVKHDAHGRARQAHRKPFQKAYKRVDLVTAANSIKLFFLSVQSD